MPVSALKWIIKLLGFILYAPIYFYLHLIKGFIFNERFDTDIHFYVWGWLPRIVLVLIGISMISMETFFIGYLVFISTIEEGKVLSVITFFVTIIGLKFLYKVGYKSTI